MPPDIDPRLALAVGALCGQPGAVRVAEAAQLGELSVSRLRSLAREQLGVPLSTWLLWRKLERAIHALSRGASQAQAAIDGGFADQAHLSRTTRRMFGVTPRPSLQRATDLAPHECERFVQSRGPAPPHDGACAPTLLVQFARCSVCRPLRSAKESRLISSRLAFS